MNGKLRIMENKRHTKNSNVFGLLIDRMSVLNRVKNGRRMPRLIDGVGMKCVLGG